MKHSKNIFSLLSVALLTTLSVTAQDIHFSQFLQTPLVINPAQAGNFAGDQRVILNHKDQWRSVGAAPYQTSLLSFDMGILKRKWEHSYLGAGLVAYKDKAGDTQLGTTNLNLTLSGIVSISDYMKISAGLQGGFMQRSINQSAMKWGNQFQFDGTSTGYNTDGAGENSAFSPYTFGDFSAGLLWTYAAEESTLSSNDKFRAHAGVAAFHLNQPKGKFDPAYIDKTFMKIIGHAGVHIGLGNTNLAFQPSLFYMKQGPSTELFAGAFFRYMLKEGSKYTGMIKETAVSLGGYVRTKDAIVPTLLVEFANFAVGVSYDVNVSELKTISSNKGGLEVSVRFINPNPFRSANSKGETPRF